MYLACGVQRYSLGGFTVSVLEGSKPGVASQFTVEHFAARALPCSAFVCQIPKYAISFKKGKNDQ